MLPHHCRTLVRRRLQRSSAGVIGSRLDRASTPMERTSQPEGGAAGREDRAADARARLDEMMQLQRLIDEELGATSMKVRVTDVAPQKETKDAHPSRLAQMTRHTVSFIGRHMSVTHPTSPVAQAAPAAHPGDKQLAAAVAAAPTNVHGNGKHVEAPTQQNEPGIMQQSSQAHGDKAGMAGATDDAVSTDHVQVEIKDAGVLITPSQPAKVSSLDRYNPAQASVGSPVQSARVHAMGCPSPTAQARSQRHESIMEDQGGQRE